jgi:hypothetical protein
MNFTTMYYILLFFKYIFELPYCLCHTVIDNFNDYENNFKRKYWRLFIHH